MTLGIDVSRLFTDMVMVSEGEGEGEGEGEEELHYSYFASVAVFLRTLIVLSISTTSYFVIEWVTVDVPITIIILFYDILF